MNKVIFEPTLKNYKVQGGKVTIQLEVASGDIAKNLGGLAELEGGRIKASLQPQTISYEVKYHKESGKPAERYGKDENDKWDKFIEEQTNLMDAEEFENREFEVEISTIDEFIKQNDLVWNGAIDLKPVLQLIEHGGDLEDIAENYGITVEDVENELDEARQTFAPYAAAWAEMNGE